MSPVTPPGYARVVPFVYVKDTESALAFYEDIFGLRRENVNMQDGRIVHAELAADGVIVLMVAPEQIHGGDGRSPASSGSASPTTFLVYVASADAAHAAALRRGAKSIQPPGDVPWGERHALFQDPDGWRWLAAHTIPPA
ncbi:MAG: VOC family protein [Planctomycetes bacterium]|nr:VOC family protein [Planctomycetota bacterium]